MTRPKIASFSGAGLPMMLVASVPRAANPATSAALIVVAMGPPSAR